MKLCAPRDDNDALEPPPGCTKNGLTVSTNVRQSRLPKWVLPFQPNASRLKLPWFMDCSSGRAGPDKSLPRFSRTYLRHLQPLRRHRDRFANHTVASGFLDGIEACICDIDQSLGGLSGKPISNADGDSDAPKLFVAGPFGDFSRGNSLPKIFHYGNCFPQACIRKGDREFSPP